MSGLELDVDANLELHLRVQRPKVDTVAVELVVESGESDGADFSISCRVAITVEPTSDDELDHDAVLRGVAARIGPVVVYPYIREFLSTLSQRSGMQPIVLPVMNIGLMFDPESVELPPVPQGDGNPDT